MGKWEVKIDETSYRDLKRTLSNLRTTLPRAAVSAMQKCATRVVNNLVNETAVIVNLTKGRIKDDIKVSLSGGAVDAKLSGFSMVVRSTGAPVGLIHFASNVSNWNPMKPKPIRVKVFKNGSAFVFKHAFIAKGRGKSIKRSGYKEGEIKEHMWQREKHFGRKYVPGFAYWRLPHGHRFPLKRLSSIRIQDIQSRPEVIGVVLEKCAEDLIKILGTEIDIAFKESGK